MSHPRSRTTRALFWGALVLLALRPPAAVERLVDVATTPLRLVTAIASPLRLVRRPEVIAAEARLAKSSAAEAEENLRLLLDIVHYARPSEPDLVEGRRLVHGEVVGRVSGRRDSLRVRVRDVRGIEAGLPVACGNAYVGRIAEVVPGARGDEGIAIVELVTSRSFHVGAKVAGAVAGQDVLMTVGGLDPSSRGRRAADTEVRLAVHNPSDRELADGLARVHELFEEAEAFSALSEGLRLGRVRRDEKGGRWSIEPELDYKDGLYWVVILAPPDPALPSREPVEEDFFQATWVRAAPLTLGDASPWREAVRISRGRVHGVAEGAAVTSVGRRLVGRVGRVGPWSADVSLLGDPGFSVVAVARLEGVAEPQVLGRLVSLGRDREDGAVLLQWVKRVELDLASAAGDEPVRARLYTGSGDSGLQCGYYLGEGLLPRRAEDPRIIRLTGELTPSDLGALFVRVEEDSQ